MNWGSKTRKELAAAKRQIARLEHELRDHRDMIRHLSRDVYRAGQLLRAAEARIAAAHNATKAKKVHEALGCCEVEHG